MKAISWASGEELNYSKKRKRFLLRLQTFFLNFCHVFNVFYFYLNVFLHLCRDQQKEPDRFEWHDAATPGERWTSTTKNRDVDESAIERSNDKLYRPRRASLKRRVNYRRYSIDIAILHVSVFAYRHRLTAVICFERLNSPLFTVYVECVTLTELLMLAVAHFE